MSFLKSKPESHVLLASIHDAIDAYEVASKSPSYPREITVRWDADMITSSGPFRYDLPAMRLLVCLKQFEMLTISLRHLDRATVDRFVTYANKSGHHAAIVSLDNEEKGPTVRNRTASCEFKFDQYVFKYWNDDFLPNLQLKYVGYK